MAQLIISATRQYDWPSTPVYPRQKQALPEGTALRNGSIVIAEELGRGGRGITYRASLRATGEWIAVKEFFPTSCERIGELVVPMRQASAFAGDKLRFLSGAAKMEGLNHPHIVKILSCFEENGTAYIAMELLRGRTLDAIVTGRGPLSEAVVAEVLEKAGDGLRAVHALGLLHLDIKPDNLMWLDDGNRRRVVIFDFDLVRRIETTSDRCTRALNSATGTPGYAALEQYAATSPLRPSADVYALGATAYHLLHGAPPDPAPERALREDDNIVALKPPIRDRDLRRALRHSLRLAANDRPANIDELLAELHGMPSAPASIPTLSYASDIQPVRERDLLQAAPWNEVRLQTLQCEWPIFCACCCSAADSWRVVKVDGELLEVPYCTPCLRHSSMATRATVVTVWGIAGGLALAAIGYWCSTLLLGPVGVVIHFSAMAYGALTFLRAEAMTKTSCADRKEAVQCRGHHGAKPIMGFRSKQYLAEFRVLNKGSVQ